MEEASIEGARKELGEIVDRARLAGRHTLITRQGKPAAVVVGSEWYAAVAAFLADAEALEAYRSRASALSVGRRVAGLAPQDGRVVNHIDGNPYNNDPSNLEIVDPKENR